MTGNWPELEVFHVASAETDKNCGCVESVG